jgi:GAF domain-containing protein
MGAGLTEYIIRHHRPVLFADAAEVLNEDYQDEIESIGTEARSWLGVPMSVGDEVLGVLAMQSYDKPYLYDDHDLSLLSAIAGQTAISLRSARLYERAEQRALLERQIYQITTRMRRSPDVSSILQTTVDELGQALQADRAVVRLKRREAEDGDGHTS